MGTSVIEFATALLGLIAAAFALGAGFLSLHQGKKAAATEHEGRVRAILIVGLYIAQVAFSLIGVVLAVAASGPLSIVFAGLGVVASAVAFELTRGPPSRHEVALVLQAVVILVLVIAMGGIKLLSRTIDAQSQMMDTQKRMLDLLEKPDRP